MTRHHRFTRWLLAMAWVTCAMPASFATPGQLPLGYRIGSGAYPWTGRLHALAFRTASMSSSPVQMPWEAGAQLDRQSTSARRLYLGGSQLVPLRWSAIDDDARALLDDVAPAGSGQARLAWLQGDLRDAALRPRDTRLGSAAGARVHVVAPPVWLPMQPGHTDFRQRHAGRPTMVWLGTRDGLLHGFDAVTGNERAGYLPRAVLPAAAALTDRAGAVPAAPCPRPTSIDADPSGTWRTLLLCAIPARNASSFSQGGAVFVLDVSAPDAETPIRLLWEVEANNALPLSGSGPIGAAMWQERGERRWAVVAIIAPDAAAGARAGLALLPMDRPAPRWSASADVPRIALPDSGCDMTTESVPLLAVTIRSTADGAAHMAYATDSAGRLWRFQLGHLSTGDRASPPTCMHRQRATAGDNAEAPVVVQTGAAPLVVYGAGNELSAIPDRPGVQRSPASIQAWPTGDGVVLRPAQVGAHAAADGWTLTLPQPGERIDTLHSVSPVHLGFTTVDADGQRRSYLVDAATGESVTTQDSDGAPVAAVTGLPWSGGTSTPLGIASTLAAGQATAPGGSTRDTFAVDLWQVEGNLATLLQQARWHRRRGRLGWRELVRSPQ